MYAVEELGLLTMQEITKSLGRVWVAGPVSHSTQRHDPTSTAGAPTSPSTPSGFVVARTNLTQQPQWRSLHPGSVPCLSSSRKMAHFRSVATPRTSIGHFTILDVSKDLHIELYEPSSFLTTFHTPFGRKHMPFGISSRGVSAKNAQND